MVLVVVLFYHFKYSTLLFLSLWAKNEYKYSTLVSCLQEIVGEKSAVILMSFLCRKQNISPLTPFKIFLILAFCNLHLICEI